MKVIRKYEEWLVPGVPISDQAISEARFQFSSQSSNPARYLKMSTGALAAITKEYGIKKIPVSFTNESIQGLLLERDSELADGEWVVGIKDERVNEVKL